MIKKRNNYKTENKTFYSFYDAKKLYLSYDNYKFLLNEKCNKKSSISLTSRKIIVTNKKNGIQLFP